MQLELAKALHPLSDILECLLTGLIFRYQFNISVKFFTTQLDLSRAKETKFYIFMAYAVCFFHLR